MIINIDEPTYLELIDWMYRVGKPIPQYGNFELWTIGGGVQIMKQAFNKNEGFVSVYSFKLPPPKVGDAKEYIDFYQEWAQWAHSVDATKEPNREKAITFEPIKN